MKRRATKSGNRPLPAFRACPGCSFDFLTGEGTRSCQWFDCPYLPEELKVLCPACNYNFYTREGDAHCGSPPSCEWAAEGAARVALIEVEYGTAEQRTRP